MKETEQNIKKENFIEPESLKAIEQYILKNYYFWFDMIYLKQI